MSLGVSARAAAGGIPAQAPRDPQQVRKQAVSWYVRLCSGDATAADRQAWLDWLQDHPDHQQAWLRIESIRQSTQGIPARIATPTLQASGRNRRQLLRGIAVLAGSGSLAYLGYRDVAQGGALRPWLAQHRTGVGEQRGLLLADGSRMTLNTDSAVDVAFSATERVVRLWAGEIMIATAPHRSGETRPFFVETAQGSVRALGTRFTVREAGDRTEVTVLADSVEIRALDMPAKPVLLQAGQKLGFTRGEIEAPRPAEETDSAWEYGSIVVSDWRLGDLIAELSRYRRGHLACDPAAAGIRVSGAFPVTDIDKALAVIAKSLPVRIEQRTRYWVTVVPL